MREDHGCCVQEEGSLDHLARMDRTAVYGSSEQLTEFNDPVTVVQEQAGKDLMLKAYKLGDQVVLRFGRAAEQGPTGEPRGDYIPGGTNGLVGGNRSGGNVRAVVFVDLEGRFHGLRLLVDE